MDEESPSKVLSANNGSAEKDLSEALSQAGLKDTTATPAKGKEPAAAAAAAASPAAAAAAAAPAAAAAADDDEPLPAVNLTGLDPESVNDAVRVMQADPTSPLYSAKSFEELNLTPALLKGVYGMKFVKPSKIQEVSLPLVLANPRKDFVGQAQSGTGKTACFTLSMLSTVDEAVQSPQCICVGPTRELARQIMSVVLEMSKFTRITTKLLVKEEAVSKGQRVTEQVLVGTAGTIAGLLTRRAVDPSKVRMLVLDEADEMIRAQGQGDKSISIRKALPKSTQVLLFSATFPPEVQALLDKITREPNRITVEREKLTVEGIKQLYVDCGSDENRYRVLSDLYGALTIGQSIVFVTQKATADSVAHRMVAEGHAVSVLHGNLLPAERDAVIDEFRSGKSKVLITTNVLSRGIDIKGVTLVINYDLPVLTFPDGRVLGADPESYLHRIGRSGRFGRKGVAINFIFDGHSKRIMADIESVYKIKIEQISTDDEEKLEKFVKEAM